MKPKQWSNSCTTRNATITMCLLNVRHLSNAQKSKIHSFSVTEKPLNIPVIYAAAKAGNDISPVPVIVMEMFENCKVYDLIHGFDSAQVP